jgi:Fe-S cluster biogenesis protein NfuA
MAVGDGDHVTPGAQDAQRAQATGERVEALLADLREQAGPGAAATAEELVSCLVELYGAGLAGIIRILGEDAEAGGRLLDAMVADPLVESLLLLHDLHPLDASTRIRRAVEDILPQLGSHAGEVEYGGMDAHGVVHLRLERGAHGCGSTAATIAATIEQAVAAAAPEAAGVDVEVVEAPAELPLLQITRRPAGTMGAR